MKCYLSVMKNNSKRPHKRKIKDEVHEFETKVLEIFV